MVELLGNAIYARDPLNLERVEAIAALGTNRVRMFLTLDGRETWYEIDTSEMVRETTSILRIASLAVHQREDGTVLLFAGDQGITWRAVLPLELLHNFPVLDTEPAANVPESPSIPLYEADWKLGNPVSAVVPGWGSTFSRIFPDPEQNTVYAFNDLSAGTNVVWRSMDWGESWESLGEWEFVTTREHEVTIKQGSQTMVILRHPTHTSVLDPQWPPLLEQSERIKEKLFSTSQDPFLALMIMAYDPVNSDVILVGGTLSHDVYARLRDEWDYIPVLFLSTDGGDTWMPVDMASLTPFQTVIPFRSLGVAQDTRGDIHLFVGTKRVWHTVLSRE